MQGVQLTFAVKIKNPTRQPPVLESLAYSMATPKAMPFLQGTFTESIADEVVVARSSRTIRVPAMISFPQLLEALDQGEIGSVVDYQAMLCS